MTTVNINGNNYECLEHMSEIKNTLNGDLFNKYYNKKQMFKDFLGKVRRDLRPNGGNLEEYCINKENGYYGQFVGQKVYSGNYCYTIEFYKIEDLDFTQVDLDIELEAEQGFLVKDDNGQLYFVWTNED